MNRYLCKSDHGTLNTIVKHVKVIHDSVLTGSGSLTQALMLLLFMWCLKTLRLSWKYLQQTLYIVAQLLCLS